MREKHCHEPPEEAKFDDIKTGKGRPMLFALEVRARVGYSNREPLGIRGMSVNNLTAKSVVASRKGKSPMKSSKTLVFGSALVLFATSAAQAQMPVDVSKITCEEMQKGSLGDAAALGMWLSGYYNAKRGTSVFDVERATVNARKISELCAANPKQTVMLTIEKMLDAGK